MNEHALSVELADETEHERWAPVFPVPRVDPLPLAIVRDYGQIFAESSYFKDARDVAQACVKILFGQELGISPVQSMTGVHIVEGKPVLSADAQARLLRMSRRYDYAVTERTDQACTIVVVRLPSGEQLGASRWTMDMARRAGLANKQVWKSYPERMLFNRAITDAIHTYAPDAINGLFYDADEADDFAVPVAPLVQPQASIDAVAESDPDAETVELATSGQRRLLFKAARQSGWNDEQIRIVLRELCGTPSSDRLPAALVDTALRVFEKPPPSPEWSGTPLDEPGQAAFIVPESILESAPESETEQ